MSRPWFLSRIAHCCQKLITAAEVNFFSELLREFSLNSQTTPRFLVSSNGTAEPEKLCVAQYCWCTSILVSQIMHRFQAVLLITSNDLGCPLIAVLRDL